MIARLGFLLLVGVLASHAAAADVLKGVVRDSSGLPVGGADFDVYTLDGVLLAADDNSDADGTYIIQLAAGRYDVVCEPTIPSRLAPRLIRGVSVAGETRLNWTMAPSIRVIGRVRGPGATPVAGADLDFDRIDDGTRQPALGDRTNAFGSFAAYLEAGEYRMTVTPPDTVDLAPTRLSFVRLPTADTLIFTLVPAVHVSGTVRGAAGETVAGAQLSFERVDTGERVPAWGRTSGADGAFRAGVAAGVYHILVKPPHGARLVTSRIGPVDLQQDQALDIALSSGVFLSGRVLDRERRPLAGASWDVVNDSSGTSVPTPDDRTDLDGRYLFTVPIGRYRLVLRPPVSSGLDTLVFRDVVVARDMSIDVSYAGPEPPPPLLGARPLQNPTHRSARIRLVLPEDGPVRVEVFDVAGRHVRTVADEWRPAGTHDLAWDGNHGNGAQAHTSVYFVRVVQGGRRTVTRLIMLPD